MRAWSIAAVVLTSAGFSLAAAAASLPDLTLAGYIAPQTVNPSGNGTWCMIDGANSSFAHTQSPNATFISFAGIIYTANGSVGPNAYRIGGQARVAFSSATAGKIVFPANSSYPLAVYQPAFDNYSASYNAAAHTLIVKLKIKFPGCTLPIVAAYKS